MAVVHEKLLEELCAVCACLHHGKQIKSVVEWKEKLETVLGVYQYIPGVTPIHFCSNCVRKVTKCINDSKVTTALKPVEWVEHSEGECVSCVQYERAKVGGRRKKFKHPGRKKSVGVWTEENVPNVESNGLSLVINSLDVNMLKSVNPFYDSCLCVLCKRVIDRPLVFSGCEHGCCRGCFVTNFAGMTNLNTNCPSCGVEKTKNIKSKIFIVNSLF